MNEDLKQENANIIDFSIRRSSGTMGRFVFPDLKKLKNERG